MSAYSAHWQRQAYRIAETWQDAPEVRTLLDLFIRLSDISDSLLGLSLASNAVAGISDDLVGIECDLDSHREAAIDAALDAWEGEQDDYAAEHLRRFAKSIKEAVSQRRQEIRDANLTECLGDPFLNRRAA